MNCPDGSSTCPTGSADCHGPQARLCGRPEYEEVIRRQTARREAAREAGTPFAVAIPADAPDAVPSRPRVDYCTAPYGSRDEFLVPVRQDRHGRHIPWPCKPWEGTAARKPWEYPVVAAIVHNDQVDMLKVVIETLRAQTMRPWIHVVDAGSTEANRERLRELELSCDDVQVDYLDPRGITMTSFPVAVAMDLVFASMPPGVEYIYSTHVDVFLKSPGYLEYLAGLCDERTPVVGYQMSDRERWVTDLWRIIPSHTATMYHAPTMRKIGASWSMTKAIERLGMNSWDVASFPDTEVNLGLDLRDAGIGMRWLASDGTDPDKPGAAYAPPGGFHGRLADVGDGVWVANFQGCDAALADFPLSIHFRYPDRSGPMCRRIVDGADVGLEVTYCDGDPLATLGLPIAEIVAYCRRPGRLLIHCAAGLCRSPTLAILAKMARGRDRHEAIGDVIRGVWEGYGQAIHLKPAPLADLMAWVDDGSRPAGEASSWLCLGTEPNEPYETPWLVHERSYTAHRLYAPGLADQRHAKVQRSMAEAMERVEQWKLAASTPPGWPACRHRAIKWRCNQEMAAECAMGKGQGGIVDEADCAGCPISGETR